MAGEAGRSGGGGGWGGEGGVRGGGRWLQERNSTSLLSGVYHSLHKFLSNSGTAYPGPSWENQEGPERDERTKAVFSRKELGKAVLGSRML